MSVTRRTERLVAVTLLFHVGLFAAINIASAQDVVCEVENKEAWDAYNQKQQLGERLKDLTRQAAEAKEKLKFIHDQYLLDYHNAMEKEKGWKLTTSIEHWRKVRWSYLNKHLLPTDREKWKLLRAAYKTANDDLPAVDLEYAVQLARYERAWEALHACLENHPGALPLKLPPKPAPSIKQAGPIAQPTKKLSWEEVADELVRRKVAEGLKKSQAEISVKVNKLLWKEWADRGVYLSAEAFEGLMKEAGNKFQAMAYDHAYYKQYGKERPGAVSNHVERQTLLRKYFHDEK